MGGALLRIILYAAVVVLPVAAAAFLGESSPSVLHEAARSMALAGFMILVLQVVLAARIKWIERAFGFDILIRFHKHMAVFAVLLLLAHPLLLALSGGGWRLLIGLDLPWYIYAGKAALVLLALNVLASLYQDRLRLKFEQWRSLHAFTAPLVIVLAFTHSWVAGDDLETASLRTIWLVMLCLAVPVFAYHRFFRPLRLKQRAFRVVEVRPEAEDVHTVKLAPPEGEEIPDYLPGQFHFVTFYRGRGLPVEEHHWTISSSPTEKGFISSTIKNLGDFTSTIWMTKTGDRAAVHGAFGRFSYALHLEEKDLVFLAGGIGITPLMSMLRHMRDTGDTRSVLLLYANRNEDQIVFQKELSEIEAGGRPALEVVHVLSRPGEIWQGETGHIDRDRILEHCGELKGKVFYVCGPPAMRQSVVTGLRELGVPDRAVRLEIFSFLD
ncbi:MAG: ferric reductase-like transmembrane domain-containing protein [Deltaproteobacteria bacterium]|nr:ferric reductase-like transmembrane domain-containing protein [Deltaproteobacteria bacterium]